MKKSDEKWKGVIGDKRSDERQKGAIGNDEKRKKRNEKRATGGEEGVMESDRIWKGVIGGKKWRWKW